MKMQQLLILWSCVWSLAGTAQEITSPEWFTPQQGTLHFDTGNSQLSATLQGRSGVNQGPYQQYQSFVITLPEACDLTGQQVRMDIRSSTPRNIGSMYLRIYNADTDKPVWSFVRTSPFANAKTRRIIFQKAQNNAGFQWEKNLVSAKTADRINKIQFLIGTRQENVDLNLTVSAITIEPAQNLATMPDPNSKIPWAPKPQYATRAVRRSHPLLAFKADDILRARQNIATAAWAQKTYEQIRNRAQFYLDVPSSELEAMIPAEDAWFKCFCPHCGTQPEFAWQGNVLQADRNSIRCTRCQTVFPNEKYPENRTYTVKMPDGSSKIIAYYHGQDQKTPGDNFGPRYHIRGAINYVKLRNLYSVYNMGIMYALSGDEKYAQKTRDVLVRFAAVYPGYSVKYRATAYTSPREELMAGKIFDWKIHDSTIVNALLNAYTLTCNSATYSESDRLAIENGIAREYKWLITAFDPDQDGCSNAIPAHLTAAAAVAAVLGDHALMKWVLEDEDGFVSFIRQHYHRDGFWHENSPVYGNMATEPLLGLVATLQGYQDAESYTLQDRYDNLDIFGRIPALQKIFSGMAPATLPTGMLPAINDSAFDARQSVSQMEMAAARFPTPENIQTLQYIAKINPFCNEFSLFKRDPAWAAKTVPPPEDFRKSLIFPGCGLAILRRAADFDRRAAVVMLSGAAPHCHNSTLNFSYFDHRRELCSDLGYLSWWHENREWNQSPLTHNLVLVNGQMQGAGRRGKVELFAGQSDILSIDCRAEEIHPEVTDYTRQLFLLPLSGDRQYAADFFRVVGGNELLWIFHADGQRFTHPALPFAPTSHRPKLDAKMKPEILQNWQSAVAPAGSYHARWQFDAEVATHGIFLFSDMTTLYSSTGSGLRNPATPYAKIPLHLLMAEVKKPRATFITLLEGVKKQEEGLRQVERLTVRDADGDAIRVTHADGIDLIVRNRNRQTPLKLAEYPNFTLSGDSAVVRLDENQRLKTLWVANGTVLFAGRTLASGPPLQGQIRAINPESRTLISAQASAPAMAVKDHYLFFDRHPDGVYRMAAVQRHGADLHIQLHPGEELRLQVGDTWRMPQYKEQHFAQ